MTQSVLINNTYRVKQSNTELVRNVLKKLGAATRTEIAKETDLSIATCGNILKDLLETGEVFEDEMDNKRGGRPAQKYLYNKDFSLAICMTIHVDGDQKILRYVITNLHGEILEDKASSYDNIDMDLINALVGKLIEQYPLIRALGVGIPGISDKNGTILMNDIKELNGVEFAKIIEQNYDIEVKIASSPNLTAYGYYKNHPEFAGKTLVGIVTYKDNPFGAGVILNGKIYKGDLNIAGELSYMNFSTTGKDEKDYLSNIVTALTAVITTLGPSVIVLMGSMLTEDNFNDVCNRCKDILPEEFIPQFSLQIEASDDYLNGVINMALDSMSYGVQLVAN